VAERMIEAGCAEDGDRGFYPESAFPRRPAMRSEREIKLAVNAACKCGGAGPGEGCPACEVWHYLFPANAALTGGQPPKGGSPC